MTNEHMGVSDVLELRLNGVVVVNSRSIIYKLYNWVKSIINNR